ncbi:MAG: peptidoglycan-binding domain-containing protein [Candidatus Micrarchaeota archaeon]
MSDDPKRTTGTGDLVGGPTEVQKPPEFQQLMKPDTIAPRQEPLRTFKVTVPRNEDRNHDTTFVIQGRSTPGDLQTLLQSHELATRPEGEFKCQIVERSTGRRYDVNLDTVIAYVGGHQVSVERTITEADRFASARSWTARKSVDVAGIQKMLGDLGYLTQAQQSGTFDITTYRAVRKFQTDHNLGVDGMFGPQTLAAATNMVGSISAPPAETTVQMTPDPQVCDTSDFFEFRESKVSPGTRRGTVTTTSGDAVAPSVSTAKVSPPARETTVASGSYHGKVTAHYGDLTSTGRQHGSGVVGSGDVNSSGDHHTTVIQSGTYRGKIAQRKREDEEEGT